MFIEIIGILTQWYHILYKPLGNGIGLLRLPRTLPHRGGGVPLCGRGGGGQDRVWRWLCVVPLKMVISLGNLKGYIDLMGISWDLPYGNLT